MKKKTIIIAAVSAAVCAAGFTAAVIVCRKLFEKNYFSVNSGNFN